MRPVRAADPHWRSGRAARDHALNASITLNARAARAATRGRSWFHGDELATVDAADGSLVTVLEPEGRPVGFGMYAEHARLRLRMCGSRVRRAGPPEWAEFLTSRIGAAAARRDALGLNGPRSACRLVHAEADGVPGLVVDRYGDCFVLQITAAPLEAQTGQIVDLLEAMGARCVVARHDLPVRELEGLPRGVELLRGQRVAEVSFDEHGIEHVARPFEGHKTGFYLDQRPARAAVRAQAAGRRVLDLFSYQGAFSLAALAGGAQAALAIDQSAAALEQARASAVRNRLEGLDTRPANVFEVLRQLRDAEREFDLIVVDPPPFARKRGEVKGGIRGYRDLNRHALRLLAPGGLLVTCSCSHHVTLPMFEDVLRQAAARLPFRVILRERLAAGADHPSWIALPESEYLKSVVLERVDLP